jgi:hypothetical protein
MAAMTLAIGVIADKTEKWGNVIRSAGIKPK